MVDIDSIDLKRDLVIVKITEENILSNDFVITELSDEENIATRFGKVINIGPTATDDRHCPGLVLGEIAVFTEFAGYYVAANDADNLYKIIRGYDIIGKYTTVEDMFDKMNIIPTGDRVLVEVIDIAKQNKDFLFDTNDPKLAALSYGKIVKISKKLNKSGLKENQIVAFAPYVGTDIRNYESEDSKALKVIVEDDILFTA